MATRGRKPKPTALKVLKGNPGKRPLNDAEPKPRAGRPTCPVILKGPARREWNRIVPELEAMGMLTHVDRAALAGYCEAWGRYVRAVKAVAKTGEIVRTPKGALVQNPYLSVLNRALKQVIEIGAEFGLTPSSRSRIQVPGAPGAVNPFMELMG